MSYLLSLIRVCSILSLATASGISRTLDSAEARVPVRPHGKTGVDIAAGASLLRTDETHLAHVAVDAEGIPMIVRTYEDKSVSVHKTGLNVSPARANSSSSGAPKAVVSPGNATVLGDLEQPRNRLLLIIAMVIGSIVAASMYLAARVQVKKTLDPVPKADVTQVNAQLPSSSKATASTTNSTTTTSATQDEHEPSSPTASTQMGGGGTGEPGGSGEPSSSRCAEHPASHCQGFASPSAWRDPTVDLQVTDTSLEAWSSRRRSESLRRLGGCALLTTVLFCTEVSVGFYVGSLSLLSNGFHLISDVAMYASLFFAVRESERVADRKSFSFGLHRLEVVGVMIALVIQYIMAGNLAVVAVGRLLSPEKHLLANRAGQIICLTSTGSLIVNSSLALWLGKSCNVHSHSHVHGGMASKMAWLHLVTDAVQNSIVILTGGLLWIDPTLVILDPICTLVFAVLVVGGTVSFMRQLLFIVMERAPEDLDCEKMFTDLERINGVIGVHCCHCWSIAQGKVAMTAHMHVMTGQQDDVMQQAQIILRHRYGIHHTTLQISDDEDLS